MLIFFSSHKTATTCCPALLVAGDHGTPAGVFTTTRHNLSLWVMSDLPRWHTQRCGRCQNSRYLYGQTRALPLSSSFEYVFGQNVTEHNPAP